MPTSRLSDTSDLEVVDFVLSLFELAVSTVLSIDDIPLPRRPSLFLEMLFLDEAGDWAI